MDLQNKAPVLGLFYCKNLLQVTAAFDTSLRIGVMEQDGQPGFNII